MLATAHVIIPVQTHDFHTKVFKVNTYHAHLEVFRAADVQAFMQCDCSVS